MTDMIYFCLSLQTRRGSFSHITAMKKQDRKQMPARGSPLVEPPTAPTSAAAASPRAGFSGKKRYEVVDIPDESDESNSVPAAQPQPQQQPQPATPGRDAVESDDDFDIDEILDEVHS